MAAGQRYFARSGEGQCDLSGQDAADARLACSEPAGEITLCQAGHRARDREFPRDNEVRIVPWHRLTLKDWSLPPGYFSLTRADQVGSGPVP
jgi:hypothetical protein